MEARVWWMVCWASCSTINPRSQALRAISRQTALAVESSTVLVFVTLNNAYALFNVTRSARAFCTRASLPAAAAAGHHPSRCCLFWRFLTERSEFNHEPLDHLLI